MLLAFEHNGVLRAVPTGIFGDTYYQISYKQKGHIDTFTHSVSITGYELQLT
jgi:hypothetical protein